MKANVCKALALILALTSLSLFAGCTTLGQPSEQQSTEQPITEKQVWLMTKSYVYSEGTIGTHTYDEYGNEIRNECVNIYDGSFRAAWIYEYDQNHHLIKRTVDTGDGTPFVQLIQTWDENGRLIKKEEMGSVITYQYDEQGRLLRELAGESETVSKIYIYYEDGSYKVESVSDPENHYSIYNRFGKVTERRSYGSTSIYVYTEDGILTEYRGYSSEGVMTQQYFYESDVHGNMIKIYREGRDGEQDVMEEYEYELFTVKVDS